MVNTLERVNEAFLTFYQNLFIEKKQQPVLAGLVSKGKLINANHMMRIIILLSQKMMSEELSLVFKMKKLQEQMVSIVTFLSTTGRLLGRRSLTKFLTSSGLGNSLR